MIHLILYESNILNTYTDFLIKKTAQTTLKDETLSPRTKFCTRVVLLPFQRVAKSTTPSTGSGLDSERFYKEHK